MKAIQIKQQGKKNRLLLLALLVFTISCQKGDAGPQGEPGAQGMQGVQGIPGKDGSMFYNGNGGPTASVGKTGDMYLDKAGSMLYGPKTESGWGSPVNLRGDKGDTGATGAAGQQGATGNTGATGATGQAGTPGSKILSGSGNPAATTGGNGDYYLDIATGLLYGPKTANTWGTPISLVGPQGIQGVPGVAGKDGSMFYSGSGTPSASLGKTGDMYLDLSISMLYGPKNDNDWGVPLLLKGEKGDTGNTGTQGSQGEPGAAGSQILKGASILPGGKPNAALGNPGDYFLNVVTNDLWGPKGQFIWPDNPISLNGKAKVISSGWMNWVKWKDSTNMPGTNNIVYNGTAEYTIPSPIINAVGADDLNDMLNKGGAMLVYVSFYNLSNVSHPLPHLMTYDNIAVTDQTLISFKSTKTTNIFAITAQAMGYYSVHQSLWWNNFGGPLVRHRLRYVLIPSTMQFSASKLPGGKINISQLSYAEAKYILGLKD